MIANETTLHKRPNDIEVALTTIGHRMAFNNEQNPYRNVSYKKPRNEKCKTIQTKGLMALLYAKLSTNKYE